MKSKIRDAILKLTKIAAKKDNETPERFRGRLVRAADTLTDKQWAELNEVAQEWVNDGIDQLAEKTDVSEFPDGVEEVSDNKEKTKEKPAAAPKKPKRGEASHAMRVAIVQNPDAKLDELLQICTEAGFSMARSSAEVIYYETRGTLRVLEEQGMLAKGK